MGVIEKQTKTNWGRGGGVLACVHVRFKKNAEIFKMNYSPVFPVDYNGSMKY